VFAVIDTASKTGTEHDATAVTFFAKDNVGPIPLFILDWDTTQIKGAMLETGLPTVFRRLEDKRGSSWLARRFYRGQQFKDDPLATGRKPTPLSRS
jgi:hypothetical protein